MQTWLHVELTSKQTNTSSQILDRAVSIQSCMSNPRLILFWRWKWKDFFRFPSKRGWFTWSRGYFPSQGPRGKNIVQLGTARFYSTAGLCDIGSVMVHFTWNYNTAGLCDIGFVMIHFTGYYNTAGLCDIGFVMVHFTWYYNTACPCDIGSVMIHFTWNYNTAGLSDIGSVMVHFTWYYLVFYKLF